MLKRFIVSRRLSIGCFLAACLWLGVVPLHAWDNWQPITPDDLKLTSAQAGNAEAIILYHEYSSDDTRKTSTEYTRIKILTEKGKRYADVEMPYEKEGLFGTQIIDVKARTIAPDGTITPFSGQIFDKTVVKAHDIKVKVKSFSFPNVQVGSIIEWRYSRIWSDDYVVEARWIIQENLAQKKAKFSYSPFDLSGSTGINAGHGDRADGVYHVEIGLPKGVQIKNVNPHTQELDMTNIPAFEEEDFSPPAEMMKMRVYFYYGTDKMLKPEEFWKQEGKYWDKDLDKFIGHSSSVAQGS